MEGQEMRDIGGILWCIHGMMMTQREEEDLHLVFPLGTIGLGLGPFRSHFAVDQFNKFSAFASGDDVVPHWAGVGG
jgi:hypothetical protein